MFSVHKSTQSQVLTSDVFMILYYTYHKIVCIFLFHVKKLIGKHFQMLAILNVSKLRCLQTLNQMSTIFRISSTRHHPTYTNLIVIWQNLQWYQNSYEYQKKGIDTTYCSYKLLDKYHIYHIKSKPLEFIHSIQRNKRLSESHHKHGMFCFCLLATTENSGAWIHLNLLTFKIASI